MSSIKVIGSLLLLASSSYVVYQKIHDKENEKKHINEKKNNTKVIPTEKEKTRKRHINGSKKRRMKKRLEREKQKLLTEELSSTSISSKSSYEEKESKISVSNNPFPSSLEVYEEKMENQSSFDTNVDIDDGQGEFILVSPKNKKNKKYPKNQFLSNKKDKKNITCEEKCQQKPESENRVTHCRITKDQLDIAQLCEIVKSPFSGAIVTFSGTTRNNFQGKTVTKLEYEAYNSMAEKELYKICNEMRHQWPDIINIAIEHKIGSCPILDTSVIIAVSSAHREAALESAKYAINTLKQNVPIWKKEIYSKEKPVWKENKEFFTKSKTAV